MKMIAKFTKGDDIKFCSHLDTQKLLTRGMSRADIPVAFSQGFNKHPLVSLAMALPVGVLSEGEYVELDLQSEITAEEFVQRMNDNLPRATRIVDARVVEDRFPALMSQVYAAKYRVYFENAQNLKEKTAEILNKTSIIINKKTKSKTKETDIRDLILGIEAFDNYVECVIRCGATNLKPVDFASLYELDFGKITRVEMYGADNEGRLIELMKIMHN